MYEKHQLYFDCTNLQFKVSTVTVFHISIFFLFGLSITAYRDYLLEFLCSFILNERTDLKTNNLKRSQETEKND
ncbi:hypothetical protein BpHYR1_020321 [Brachionus plicatilis]|uniref:Uncharacterized protein n=1 Tax=Brachionus plicatilis TaxID=10195 RepID=A0A3M7SZQ4_BRAPC|nr:hypothetical protein BpHYR1_020321 [Brachionus plicatilis]